jgi:PAS domain S-box-containing protein
MQNSTYIIGGVVAIFLVTITTWGFVRSRGKHRGTTQTTQLATKLKGEQLKSDIILSAIDDGVVLVDDQQMIALLNPAGAAMLGWDRKEGEGLDWRSVFKFVDDKGQVQEGSGPIQEVFATGKSVHHNNAQLNTKSGKIVTVSMTVSPLLRAGESISAAVGIFRDVSEERQQEAQRAEFISTASHEMRTPVAAIEGYLSLALNDKVSTIDTRARGYLDKAHDSTRHLGKLFQDLLTSAKAEDGRLSNHPVIIEIGEMLEGLTEDFRFTAEKKGLQIEFTLGSGKTIDASDSGSKVVRPLYYVQADQERLREVITNLFDNAIKYTESGKITIGLTGDKDVVQFYVRDTGNGIPKEDIPHLFQKFYRVDNSATRTIGGTGLGLFISRKIIELYEGRIWVTSEFGKGSTFYINLPRIDAKRAQELRSAETEDSSTNTVASLTRSQ